MTIVERRVGLHPLARTAVGAGSVMAPRCNTRAPPTMA
jgi:hypothetical protein